MFIVQANGWLFGKQTFWRLAISPSILIFQSIRDEKKNILITLTSGQKLLAADTSCGTFWEQAPEYCYDEFVDGLSDDRPYVRPKRAVALRRLLRLPRHRRAGVNGYSEKWSTSQKVNLPKTSTIAFFVILCLGGEHEN
jgi:hypothetical protein